MMNQTDSQYDLKTHLKAQIKVVYLQVRSLTAQNAYRVTIVLSLVAASEMISQKVCVSHQYSNFFVVFVLVNIVYVETSIDEYLLLEYQ